MSTTGVSSRRSLAVGLSVGFMLAPVAVAISSLMDRLSSPDDGADIGAGLFLLLAMALFVGATVAFVVVLALGKLTKRQSWCVTAIAAVCFVLVRQLFFMWF